MAASVSKKWVRSIKPALNSLDELLDRSPMFMPSDVVQEKQQVLAEIYRDIQTGGLPDDMQRTRANLSKAVHTLQKSYAAVDNQQLAESDRLYAEAYRLWVNVRHLL
jgi:hypothetical protein